MARAIDNYSLAAKPLDLRFGDTTLAIATGFIWHRGAEDFLVTNWHNVTGMNPNTGKHISPKAGEPDRLVAFLDRRGKLGVRVPFGLMLRDKDGQPLWLEHPKYGRKVDVVAISITLPNNIEPYAINTMKAVRMREAVGHDAFILGYPFGIGPALLPIWKRASIASEPQMGVGKLPCFFADTASREGMSGAPVIRREWGAYEKLGGPHLVTPGAHTEFIGVYSGRIGAADELQAQLGIIWRAEVVEQIVDGGRIGSRP